MSAQESDGSGLLRLRSGLVLMCFLAIIGFLLFTEPRAHVLGFLPFALLLSCPFLHMFYHGGHGGHDHAASGGEPVEKGPEHRHHEE